MELFIASWLIRHMRIEVGLATNVEVVLIIASHCTAYMTGSGKAEGTAAEVWVDNGTAGVQKAALNDSSACHLETT